MTTITDAQLRAYKAAVRSKYIVLVLLKHYKGQDYYPDTIATVYNLLTNYKCFKSIQFIHQEELTCFNEKSGKPCLGIKDLVCNKCKKKEHYANKCPSLHVDDSKNI